MCPPLTSSSPPVAMARFLLAVCVALLALQGSHANTLQYLAQGVVDTVQTLVDDVQDFVENVRNAVEAEAAKIEAAVKSVFDSIKSAIDEKVAEAKAKGAAVEQCVEGVPAQLEDFAQATYLTAYHCIADPIVEAKTIVTDTIQLVRDANDTINSIAPKVQACTDKLILVQPKCYVDAFEDVLTDVKAISSKANDEITEAKELIASLEDGAILECEENAIKSIPQGLQELLDNLESCLKAAVTS